MLNGRDSNEPVSARRRLLRGSFAVPAVLTLGSGSALANASTIRCFNNAPSADDPDSRSMLGVQRYSLTSGQTTTIFVKRTELAAVQGFANSAFLSLSSNAPWILLDGTGYTPTGNDQIPQPVPGKTVGLRFTYNPGAGAGQKFSLAGLTTGASSGGSGKVMYQSCWTSVSPIR